MMRLVLAFLVPVFLAGCLGTQAPAPVTHFGQAKGAGSAGAHIVEGGDTLYSVSKRYRLPLQEIAIINDLHAPFALEVHQRLKLPPPNEYVVKQGDSVSRVARIFDISPSQISRLNNLRSPYRIHAGDRLRLPSQIQKTAQRAQRSASAQKQNVTYKPAHKPGRVEKAPVQQVSLQRPIAPKKLEKIKTRTPARANSNGKFLKPVHGRTLSGYGPKRDGLHNDGINIAAPKGAPVRAAENGVVVYAGSELRGSGNLVLIRHRKRYMTAYAHMDKILIKRGDVIKRGQSIGTVGSTGSVSEPQLHFEVRRGTKAVDPKKYLES